MDAIGYLPVHGSTKLTLRAVLLVGLPWSPSEAENVAWLIAAHYRCYLSDLTVQHCPTCAIPIIYHAGYDSGLTVPA